MPDVVVRQVPCSCPQSLILGTWTTRHKLECQNWRNEPDNNDHALKEHRG